MAHQVVPEAVDLVVLGPQHRRVDHDLLAHGVLGGHVLAAGRGRHRAVGVQPLVVAGHHLVEHRGLRVPRGRGVVVDLVEHHPQTRGVQPRDHGAELGHPGSAVGLGRRRGVRALRRHPVPRVVAPVEGVRVGDRGHAGLLLLAVGGVRRQVAVRGLLVRGILRDRGDVEGRQQVHRVQPRLGEGAQVLPAGALGVGEGEVGASMVRRHALVVDREVADVQLVDRRVHRSGQLR